MLSAIFRVSLTRLVAEVKGTDTFHFNAIAKYPETVSSLYLKRRLNVSDGGRIFLVRVLQSANAQTAKHYIASFSRKGSLICPFG
jgi:hypothetical protein